MCRMQTPNLYDVGTFSSSHSPQIGRFTRPWPSQEQQAMATMACTLVQQPLARSVPLRTPANANAAANSKPSQLPCRTFEKVSAFFGASLGTRFAFRGAVTTRVAEKRRKRVGVIRAKRMASSEDVATRAPDFEVRLRIRL